MILSDCVISIGMMSHLDHNIGRIVDTLKHEGIYGDPLIIFASDVRHSYND